MNAEKVMAAIGKIGDKYIEEAAVVKPVKHDRIDRMVRRKWITRLSACLAVIALAVGTGILLLNNGHNDSPLLPFALIAYAMAEDGTVVEQEVTDTIHLPLSVVETEDGLKGFLFSVEAMYGRNDPPVTVINDGLYEETPVSLFHASGIELQPGRAYFYFIDTAEKNPEMVSFSYTDEKENATIGITVQITETDDGYYAKLQEFRTYPRMSD